MAMKNMIPIGNLQLEATCVGCGAVFILEKGDDYFTKKDSNGDWWPLCSKCYTGPKADPLEVIRRRKKILGEDQNS
jgi:hypothetical protein